MRILVDIYDPTGTTRLGEGPVMTCESATVSRRLDGQGRLKLSGSLTDKRAGDLLQNERVVRVWLDTEAGMREFARGVILEIRKAVRHSDAVVVCLSQASTRKVGYVQKEIRQALDAT